MGEHIVEVLSLLGFITMLLMGFAKWIFSKTIDDIDDIKKEHRKLETKHHNLELAMARLETEITEELAGIKTNYMARFDGILREMSKHHEESIREISKLNENIAKQQQFCYLQIKKQEDKK